jgi:hypothetical protein
LSALPLSPDSRLDALIARLRTARDLHIVGSGCTDEDLRVTEERLSQPLPQVFRLFLQRQGGGIYYLRHEIFGARRVMVHDIEMVPDLLSFNHWLGTAVPDGWLAIHRSEGRVHAIRVGVKEPAPVRAIEVGGPSYPDFTNFLESLIQSQGGTPPPSQG